MTQKFSIVQIQKHVIDPEQEGEKYYVHPVMWLRIDEPFDELVDAYITLNKFPFPEDYIIVPHYSI